MLSKPRKPNPYVLRRDELETIGTRHDHNAAKLQDEHDQGFIDENTYYNRLAQLEAETDEAVEYVESPAFIDEMRKRYA